MCWRRKIILVLTELTIARPLHSSCHSPSSPHTECVGADISSLHSRNSPRIRPFPCPCVFVLWQVGCYQEILVLLWKFLDENNGFLNYVLSDKVNVNRLVVPMLYLMWSGRLQPSKVRTWTQPDPNRTQHTTHGHGTVGGGPTVVHFRLVPVCSARHPSGGEPLPLCLVGTVSQRPTVRCLHYTLTVLLVGECARVCVPAPGWPGAHLHLHPAPALR